MRRNAVRFMLLFVSFCLWHFRPPHVSFAQSPRQPKLLEQKLSEVSSDKVSDWIKVQIEDLGYGFDIAEKVGQALSGFTRQVLMRMSRDDLFSELGSTTIDGNMKRALARGLNLCIQAAPQPQPLQPVATPSETDKPFALALDDAKLDESGRMLTTEKGSFKRQSTSEIWNEKKFYIRECYQHIADLMFQKNPPAMSLLGSSGIGKSNFMIYLIWRRFQDPELSKFPVFLHRLDKITQFKTGEEPLEVDVRTLRSAPSQALYIMDADNQYECYVDCQSLWITSARKPESPAFNTEHFKHANNCCGEFFLPPWTLDEMLDAKAMPLHGLPQQVVEERFGIFGGTARFVLRTDENLVQKDRERLEGALNSADALSTLEISSDMKAISKNTHLLVKMYPKRNFSFFDVNVSSPYVCQELVKRNWQKRRKALWERIEEGRITGIGFALFEEAFHQFMQDQKLPKVKLRARRLTRDGTQSDTTVEFTGGLDGVLITGNPKPVIEAGKYYQPTSKTFPAFDAWTSEGLFQMTVAATHKIKFPEKGEPGQQASKVAVEAAKKHGGKVKFYFVVPSFQFDGGWKGVQKVDFPENPEMEDKIEQWVVCFEENLPK